MMFDFIVVLCLAGEPKNCMIMGQPTPDCVRSLRHVKRQAPKDTVIRAVTCARQQEMELPPMTIRPVVPKKEPKKKELET